MATVDELVFISAPVYDVPITIPRVEEHPVCLSCREYLGEYNMRQLCEKTTCVDTSSLEEIVYTQR